jgi:hypothetical protein
MSLSALNRPVLPSTNTDASEVKQFRESAQTVRRYYVLLLVLMVLISTLHFALPNHAENIHSLTISRRIGYTFNADSALYAWTVITFPRGLATETGSIRRGRPLYPAFGWAVYQALHLMRWFVPRDLADKGATLARQSNTGAMWRNIDGQQIVLAWVALIIVNLLISGTALLLIFHALRAIFEPRLALLLTLIPAVHSDAIDFYLVPHTEPFNLLIPALFLCALAAWPIGRSGIEWSLPLGVSMLAKLMPFMVPNWLLEWVALNRSSAAGNRRSRARLVAAGAIMILLPTIFFVILLHIFRVPVYNYEAIQYRMFVWMLDAARAHHPATIFVRVISGLVEYLRVTAIAFAVPLAACVVMLAAPTRRHFRLAGRMWLHLLVYSCSCAMFWACSGYIWKRLTITEFPVVIYAFGCLSMSRWKRPEWIVCAAVIGTIITRVFGVY